MNVGILLIAMAIIGCEPPSGEFVTQRYDVNDLIRVSAGADDQIPDMTRPDFAEQERLLAVRHSDEYERPPGDARLAELQQYVRDNVQPKSWQIAGRSIRTELSTRVGASLLVTQTRKEQADVRELLDEMRALRTPQITCHVWTLVMDEQLEQGLSAPLHRCLTRVHGAGRDRTDVRLTSAQVNELLHALNPSGAVTNSLGEPRITLFNGQRATIQFYTQQAYIADYKPSTTQPTELEPVVEAYTSGGAITQIGGCISSDHATVFVDVRSTKVLLASFVSEPFHSNASLTIQQPVLSVRKISAVFAVPDGGIALLSAEPEMVTPTISFNADSIGRKATLEEIKKLTEKEPHRHFYLLIEPVIVKQGAEDISEGNR